MSKPSLTSCWGTAAEPADCKALAYLVIALHVAVALAPWAAGCGSFWSVALGSACLAGLPAAARAVPGRRCALRSLAFDGDNCSARLAGGEEHPARVEPSTRVLPGIVFCRLSVAGRRLDWWVPRHALTATQFRRLKVALRCRSPAAAA